MIVINRFSCSMLMASVALFSNYSLARGAAFEVSTGTSVTNGAVGRVLDGDKTLNITPKGSIEVTGVAAAPLLAIRATGIGNTVENEGEISAIRKVVGAVTRGISSEVDAGVAAAADADAVVKSTITNSGNLTAEATVNSDVTGIFSGMTIVNDHGVAVAGATDAAVAAAAAGVKVAITNSGKLIAKLTAAAGKVSGIHSRNMKVAIINSGDLTASTTGTGDVTGISSEVDAGVAAVTVADAVKTAITNSGKLIAKSTGDGTVSGIHYRNMNAAITNSGELTASTTGSGKVYGIFSEAAVAGVKVAVTNSGTISAFTTGSGEVAGISVAAGVNATISNSGTISAFTTGSGEVAGISVAAGVNATISNSGSITASTTGPDRAYGLFFARGGSLVNSGTIIASSGTGVRSYAVGGGGIITISNSGSIIGSVKHDIPAMVLTDGGFLEFRKGSFIVGDMLLAGATSISIDGDQPRSLHYVFTGADSKPQVSGSSPVFYSDDDREVAILDTRYLTAGIDALEVMTGSVSGLIRSRRFVQDVSKSHVWVSGALSRRVNGKNDGFFALNNGDRSFAAGVDGSPSAGLSVGGLVGTNVGSKMVVPADKVSSSHESSTDGLFAAVHAIQRFDHVFLQTAVSGGFLKHNDEHFIQDNTVDSGIDVARSSYHSYWYSPEVTLGVGISAFDWTYTPSVNLRYARQLVDAYGEEGSKSNVTYNWRSISLLSGRAGLAVDRQFSFTHLTLRTGLQSFGLIGRTDASLGMLGKPAQTFVIQSGHKKGVYGGVDVAMQLSQNASVTLGGEAVVSKDKKMNTHLTAGLDVAF